MTDAYEEIAARLEADRQERRRAFEVALEEIARSGRAVVVKNIEGVDGAVLLVNSDDLARLVDLWRQAT